MSYIKCEKGKDYFWGNIDEYYVERIFNEYSSKNHFNPECRPFMVRCGEKIHSDRLGNTFTLMVQTLDNDNNRKMIKFKIVHECSHHHCSIDCHHDDRASSWRMITAKSESKIAIKIFNSCNELINYYKNNEVSIRMYGMETKFKLGKPISLPETIKIMEKEIKNAERAKTKYQLLQQLLAEQEQDDDWELVPGEQFVPDQSNELNELIKSAQRKQQMCVCVVNNCMRIKGICKIEAEVIKQQSISRLATQISHPWFWKLKRDQAIRILESESLPQKGNFCVRPRKDDNDCLNGQAPYALSFVLKTANNKVEKIEHKLIYWDESTGFHFSDTDERIFNQLGDFIEHHLSRGGLYHYERDSLQESKEDISREYPLLKTRDNLNSDYLYNLFKKIAE